MSCFVVLQISWDQKLLQKYAIYNKKSDYNCWGNIFSIKIEANDHNNVILWLNPYRLKAYMYNNVHIITFPLQARQLYN